MQSIGPAVTTALQLLMSVSWCKAEEKGRQLRACLKPPASSSAELLLQIMRTVCLSAHILTKVSTRLHPMTLPGVSRDERWQT